MNLKYVLKIDLIDAIDCKLVFIELHKLNGVQSLMKYS